MNTSWLLLAAVSLLAAACGQSGATKSKLMFGELPQGGSAQYSAAVRAGAPTLVAVNEAAAARSDFVLVAQRGTTQSWISPTGISLTTQNQQIIATRGLGDDAIASDPGRAMAIILGSGSGTSQRVIEGLDGSDKIVTRRFECRFSSGGTTSVGARDGEVMARAITETCSPILGGASGFTNVHYVANGRLVLTRQWVSPMNGTILLQFNAR